MNPSPLLADSTASIIATEEAWQLKTYPKMPVALVRGEGPWVWDAEGRRYLDFYGGHCVTPLGHCPPAVVRAIREQAGTLLFYSNVVYSPVRAAAAERIARMAPEGLQHVFFCNSGTEANETALKIARKASGKPVAIAMEHAFHGRTLGSLAVTDGHGYRDPYLTVLPETVFVPFGDAGAVARVLASRNDVAALILEPIQSMAGIFEAPPEYYQALRRLCDENDVALIFDEVQTGVGRTGTFSVSEQYGMKPDLISMAKSLGSGVPIGAVLVSDRLAGTVGYGDQGTTFGGGMLAMAAAAATIDAIVAEGAMQRAAEVFTAVRYGLAGRVREVRGRGCLMGVALHGPAKGVIARLREHGVLTGGASAPDVIRLMPPLNTPPDAVDYFLHAFHESLRETGS